MDWQNWSNVLFSERHSLPSCSGIYVIADANNCVWYVGQAANLKNRWAGKTHHRYPQLIRSNRKLCHRIYWQEVERHLLNQKERDYINLFKPELNACKVKKYLPKQPQVEREIKRLLKVINKPTMLFPVIRSVVAGKYTDHDGINCVVILINTNDSEIIFNSRQKRYAAEVKKAWSYYETYCGKDEQQYSKMLISAYNLNAYRFEFIVADWELFQHIEDNLNIQTRYVGQVEVFGIQVKALKDLNIFEELSLKEEYSYINYDGKKILKTAAYLNYRKQILSCIPQIG
jgi:hypothetical protein